MTANTTFTVGQVLTASNANAFPFGYMGVQTLTTAFTTSSTHTTFQDNGMTLTITEISGRVYRITAYSNIYPAGGLQGVNIQILRAGTALKRGDFSANVMDAGISLPIAFSYTYTATSSGSATYKAQIAAQTANTAVSDYGSATYPRQFLIEDLGTS